MNLKTYDKRPFLRDVWTEDDIKHILDNYEDLKIVGYIDTPIAQKPPSSEKKET